MATVQKHMEKLHECLSDAERDIQSAQSHLRGAKKAFFEMEAQVGAAPLSAPTDAMGVQSKLVDLAGMKSAENEE